MADIVLSHSSADNDAADRIKSWLERDRKSWSVFLDKHPRDGILAGQSWQDRLRSELQSCRVVLAIITPDWLASRWCFTEAVVATFRGKDFLGVLPADLPTEALVTAPPIVHERQRQRIDLTTGAGWEELLNALDQSGLDPSHWFSIPKSVGPYPGFVAFEEKDAGVFFGRDAEITEYLDALKLLKAPDRAQALVISGGSGSGKSSLLKAGLIPRLRRQPDWLIVPPFDPSREPIHALISALRATAQATAADIKLPPRPPGTVEALIELLQHVLRGIEEKTSAWLLLPLDQAEGLLAGAKDGSGTDGSRLLTAIGQLLASRQRRLVVAFTIRTEFIPRLQLALPSDVRLHEVSLRPIAALAEIIEKPAARFGIELEEGLPIRMVEDTRGADALPLLAYTLRELYEKYGDDNLLTIAEYEQFGGVEGAIENKLHEALSDPKPTAAEIAAFRRCFVRQLVRVDESAVEGERYLRTVVTRDALPDDAKRLVDRLQEARLLVGDDEGAIGIAHERLIRNWASVPLQAWLIEDSDDRKLIDNLKSLLAAHREGGPLLSEKPLLDAKHFLERDRSFEEDEPELSNFIEASIIADQNRVRRQKLLLGGAVAASLVFLVVAIVAFLFFLEAQHQTRIAKDRQIQALIAQSKALSSVSRQKADEGHITLGMLLSLEALPKQEREDRPIVPEAEASLLYAAFMQREDHVLRGHAEGVNSVRFSPDGLLVVTASRDRTARIWDVGTGKEIVTLQGHNGQVYGAEFSPDGRRVVTASSDNTARLWSVETGEIIATLGNHEGQVNQASFSPNGLKIITASDHGEAKLWDAVRARYIATLRGHEGRVWSAAFSPDGTRLVTAAEDNTAKIWDADGKFLFNLRGHEDHVLEASFSPDGERVVTASWDRTARLWNAPAGKIIAVLRGHQDGVDHAAFSPDGQLVVTTSADNTARLWDGVTGDAVGVLEGHEGKIHDAGFSPDGRWLVTASDDGTARLWEVSARNEIVALRGHIGRVWSADFSPEGQRLATASEDDTVRIWKIAPNTPIELVGHQDRVHQAIFAPDGQHVATVSDDKTARLWDGSTGDPIAVLDRHEGAVWFAVFSQNGQHLATTSIDGTVKLWETMTGHFIRMFLGHEGWVKHAHFSPDGRHIVTGAADGTARVWDVTSGTTVGVLRGHQGSVNFAEFSPNGQRILTASDDSTGRLWNAANGALIASVNGHRGPIINGAFSSDGERFVTASWDRTARLWDGASGKPVSVLRGHTDAVLSAAFSPDGRLVITASSDNTARIWDTSSGNSLVVLLGHEGEVYDASFSSDSRLAVTVSGDGTGRVWHVASGLLVATLRGHSDDVVDGAFAPGGRHVATASWDHTAKLWKLPVGTGDDWIAYATQGVARDFTDDERRLYLSE